MKEIIIVADYTEESTLTAAEICEAFGIESELLHEFVSYDIIVPLGERSEEWVFNMSQVTRLRTALRLQHDFELNSAGVALVLQLLEEMDDLREISVIYHKYLLK